MSRLKGCYVVRSVKECFDAIDFYFDVNSSEEAAAACLQVVEEIVKVRRGMGGILVAKTPCEFRGFDEEHPGNVLIVVEVTGSRDSKKSKKEKSVPLADVEFPDLDNVGKLWLEAYQQLQKDSAVEHGDWDDDEE